ncbi:CapA family protein [Variovorax sp. DAIF25]|jgi:poly-gamma-glutamate capsule biosynthesis protein CapA/YwtB (metallophosphatase superfamily)|uniref:CapA family protein n=1 Tax=Variovorax sp. DAIF25 TaxID=3080983 RepID=UPI003D6A32D7
MTDGPQQTPGLVCLVAVGDVFLNRDNPAESFVHVGELLKAGDITFGNSEGTYAVNETPDAHMMAAIIASPDNINALAQTGFDVMSVANNHINDWGRAGMQSSVERLRREGIQPVGYGRNLDKAFAPVHVTSDGKRVAFVAASMIGSWNAAATADGDGVAMLEIATEYHDLHRQPGSPPHVRSRPTEAAAARVARSFEAAKMDADFVVASFHWGVHCFPASLAEYEGILARLAIDHGADVVLGHHQHILKGVDFHKGKPILHGLGNFAFDLVDIEKIASPAAVRETIEIYGEYGIFSREGYPTVPFHEESRMTVVAHVGLRAGHDPVVELTPCMINTKGQPVPIPASDEAAFARFLAYVKRIHWLADLDSDIRQNGDLISIRPGPGHAGR